ncbi:MAG: ankyrin repeat domain-containing protein, partial [Paracoccaceae bacterium]|nr:ankyrin repeat domain-containing protein [Paracoccaceae bacterium]
ADVNAGDNDGITPLLAAAVLGHEVIVRMLIEAGADVNAGNNGGITPLHFAADRGHEDIVRELCTLEGIEDEQGHCSQ